MDESFKRLVEETNKKLDALIILNCVRDLSGEERLNLLKYSVGIKPSARMLNKDKSGFKKKLKKELANGK